MKIIDLAYDPQLWAEVPLEYPAGTFASRDDWVSSISDAFAQGEDDEAEVRNYLATVARVIPAEPRLGLFQKLWYLAEPLAPPLIVNVYIAPGTDENVTMQDLAGAYDSELVRPPIVDTLDSEIFGTFARVISVSRDSEHDRLAMRVSTTGYAHGLTIGLDAITADLAHCTLAIDDFTALMEQFTITDEDVAQ